MRAVRSAIGDGEHISGGVRRADHRVGRELLADAAFSATRSASASAALPVAASAAPRAK